MTTPEPLPLFDVADVRPPGADDPREVILRPGVVVDLCAGPGGWDEGLRATGYAGPVVGLDTETAACSTAEAAGHLRIRADIASYPLDGIRASGLIASPPCPGFSAAGARKGRGDLPAVVELVDAYAAGEPPPPVEWADPRSPLTAEPMRWAVATGPRWVALEQVPAVLPVWRAIAAQLERAGFSAWCGVLDAADYGVPQNRTRAVLLAHRDRELSGPPAATHAREGAGGLRPWVTMADALGWGMTARPYFTIASSRTTGGPDREKVGGSGARRALYAEREAGRWAWQRPATTVQGDARIWPPGHKVNADDRRRLGDAEAARRYGDRAGTDAIRLDVAECATLQGFRPDYPWRGGKGRQHQQVGNAVPPPLAAACLAALLGPRPRRLFLSWGRH